MQIEQPFELVIFGGLGDLALRKLFPALYLLELDKRLPQGKIIAVGRRSLDIETVISKVKQAVFNYVDSAYQDEACWQSFTARLSYVCLDVQQPEAYQSLADEVEDSCPNRLFYLATASFLYADIVAHLHGSQLIQVSSKVVLEKPIGHDLASAKDIN